MIDSTVLMLSWSFFFQAEDGIRDAQESRGLGDVYKRQDLGRHLKVHSGEKSKKCNQCEFSSSQTGDLRRHLEVHSGETVSYTHLTLPTILRV